MSKLDNLRKQREAKAAAQQMQETEETLLTQKTQETEETQTTPETEKKKGRPVERPETYRFSLYLDGDLKDFIKYASWKGRKSTTQYLNDLVRADMEAYIAAGGNADEWKENS